MEQPSDAEAEAAAASWEEILEEAVIKHERGSERQLYVYGISAHRCPQCRSRIKPSSKQCEACRFTHNVELKCRRCTGEAIAMWCYECDAHYCVDCYSRPHVLSCSTSGAQHSCFPIENSSGKCLGKGSWNQDFDALARSIYRLRISEKITAGAAGPLAAATAQSIDSTPDATTQPARAGEQQAPDQSAAANRPEQTPAPSESAHSAPGESHTQAAASAPRLSSTDSAVDKRRQDGASSTDVRATPVSLPASSSAPPSDVDSSTPVATEPGAESRKRQLNGNGHDAPVAKHPRTEQHTGPPAHHETSQAPASSSLPVAELSLYEQVRLMHEKRKQKPGLPPRPHPAPQHQLPEQQPSQSTQPSSEQRRDDQDVPVAQTTQSTPQTGADGEQGPSSSLAPASSPLGADHVQRIAQELEQQQQRLQRAMSSSHVSSSSAAPSVQDTDESRPRNQATYPVQHVQSPLPSPLPSPARPSSFPQLIGGPGVGLSAAPPHAAGAVGFVRSGASASHLFQASSTATIDLTAPMGPTHSFLQPQRIGDSTPAMAFESPSRPAPPPGELPNEDALLSAVLVDFNAINAHVMELGSKIQAMVNAVRKFSFQDVAKASTLNAKIAEHRGVLELARARRTQISARVMMYLPAVIEFARGADRNSWGDVPRVLTACQARLAQLAGEMSGCEQRVLRLRGLIDEAVGSNDVRRIMQVQELGDQLKQEETRLDGLKTERDNQFVLMIKFSRELREAVQREVAALSRSAGAAAGSASSA